MEINKNNNYLPSNKLIFICGILVFLISFIYLCINNDYLIIFDAKYYVTLSKSFVDSDGFSLYNYPETFRGVIFPLLLCIFNKMVVFFSTDIIFGWRLLVSLLVTLATVQLPLIFKDLIKKRLNVLEIFIPLLLLHFFWYGLINNPLSDIVSLCFFIFGLSFLRISIFRKFSFIMAIVSGLSFYIAYNTRTIYIFPIFFVIVGTLFYSIYYKKIKLNRFLFILLGLIIGILMIGMVQLIININCYDKYTISVIANYNNGNLFMYQINNGIWISQYETYFSKNYNDYPKPGIMFVDPIGQEIVSKDTSLLEYIKHPIELCGIYIRHFLNMLNPVWGGGAYITDIHSLKIHRSIINYTILFVVFKYLIKKLNGISFENVKSSFKNNYITILSIISLLICFAAILPGAVESRFALPFYLIIYGLFAYCIPLKEVWLDVKTQPIKNAIIYISIFTLLCCYWTYTYHTTGEDIPLSIW